MESRQLLRPVARALSSSSRPSLPCCYAWYASAQSQPPFARQRGRTSIRLAHTTKKVIKKIDSPKKTVKSSIKADNVNTRAFSRLDDLLQDTLQILSSPTPPQEQAVLEALSTLQDLAKYFKDTEDSSNLSNPKTNSAAANLLFLDSHNSSKPATSSTSSSISTNTDSSSSLSPSTPSPYIASSIAKEAKSKISNAAYQLFLAPSIFITPDILSSYVSTQALLSHPESFAEMFYLYANKPIPTTVDPSSSSSASQQSIKYTPSNPSKLSTAIPLPTALTALHSAIASQNLSLCLSIIETTVCRRSFKLSKFLRRALLPLSGLALTPLGAWTLASQFSASFQTLDSADATTMAFVGIMTYIGATATMGIIAVTTANDQMERVTWATGTPLRERWIREEERMMLDLVASAWGFRESWKRGEEEGEEWANLRELVGLRGMVLDRVELLEGME